MPPRHQQQEWMTHDGLEQVLCCHERLDLARALIDRQDQTVSKKALDIVVLDHAIAAEDLHAGARYTDRLFGPEVLDQRCELTKVPFESAQPLLERGALRIDLGHGAQPPVESLHKVIGD